MKKKTKKVKTAYAVTDKDLKMSAMLRRGALNALKRDLNTWIVSDRFDEQDRSTTHEMCILCADDFKDLLEIARTIETHGPDKAYQLVWNLDTSVRESIPMTVYDYICKD